MEPEVQTQNSINPILNLILTEALGQKIATDLLIEQLSDSLWTMWVLSVAGCLEEKASVQQESGPGKEGRFITEDPIKDGINWYAYVSNNPLRYIDPTGLELKSVDTSLIMDNAPDSAFLDKKKKYAVNKFGCVLTAIVRIGNDINNENGGHQFSLEEANQLAGKNDIYTKDGDLSPERSARLIGLMTGKEIGVETHEGDQSKLENDLYAADISKKEYYATGRLDTESADGEHEYKHTVNIDESLSIQDYLDGKPQSVDDTSSGDRGMVGIKREEELIKVDLFFVKEDK